MSESENFEYIKKSEIEENLIFIQKTKTKIFGKIELYKKKTDQKNLIMKKTKSVFSKIEAKKLINEIKKKISYNTKNILKPLDYNIKKIQNTEEYYISCFFDYKTNSLKEEIKKKKLHNKFFQKEKLVFFLEEILKVFKFFQNEKIFFSDINLENIFFEQKEKLFLSVNFKNIKNPFKSQIKKLKKQDIIYLSPFLFNFFLNKKKKLIFDPYKSLNFTLGLILLETGNLESIQNIYDFENKKINYNNLLIHINKFIGIYKECDILKKIIFSLLEMDFEKRKNIDEIFELLKRLKKEEKNFFCQNNFKKVETIDIDSDNNFCSFKDKFVIKENEIKKNELFSDVNTLEKIVDCKNKVDVTKYPFNQKKVLKKNLRTNFENNNGKRKSYTSIRNLNLGNNSNNFKERKSFTYKNDVKYEKNNNFTERKSFSYKNDITSQNKKILRTSFNEKKVSYKKKVLKKIDNNSGSFINSKILTKNIINTSDLNNEKRNFQASVKKIKINNSRIERNLKNEDNIRNMRNYKTEENIRNYGTKENISNIRNEENIRNYRTKENISNIRNEENVRNLRKEENIRNFRKEENIRNFNNERRSVIEKAKSTISRRTIYISCERKKQSPLKNSTPIKKLEQKIQNRIMAHEIYIPNNNKINRKSFIEENSKNEKNDSISEIDKFGYKISKSPNRSRKYILTRSKNSVLNRVKSRSIQKNENNKNLGNNKISDFNNLEGGLISDRFENLILKEKRINFQVFRVDDSKVGSKGNKGYGFKPKYQSNRILNGYSKNSFV